MRLIQLLNQLDEQGTLGQLYQAGVVGLAAYTQREIYNYYHALLSTPRYTDQPSKAVHATAEGCKVDLRTVYRVLRRMEQQVG